jgi:nicotinamidase-related amidase
MSVSAPAYPAGRTALLLVDPYNDFLAEGGKLWPAVAEVATAVDLLANLRRIRDAVHCARWPLFIVPHHRATPHDLAGWTHATPYQLGASQAQVFARDGWGGEWHPDLAPEPHDIIVKEHWAGSGFANTDLDLLLKQHGISHVIVVGLIANTCIETTARFASELGYHVTLVRDATAAFSQAAMQAAHDINGPTYAHAIVSTRELLARIPFSADP